MTTHPNLGASGLRVPLQSALWTVRGPGRALIRSLSSTGDLKILPETPIWHLRTSTSTSYLKGRVGVTGGKWLTGMDPSISFVKRTFAEFVPNKISLN
jgi:hypothetical protein